MVEKTSMTLCERGVEVTGPLDCQHPHQPGMTSIDTHIHSQPMTMQPLPLMKTEEHPSICAGCSGRIVDRFYLMAVDKQWHTSCLKCSECCLRLDSELTCFAKDGNIYCKEDYYRRFAVKRCARCHMGIAANELVMRAKDCVYHISCFTCASCHQSLTPGEQFGMKDSMIYCRAHYELLIQGDYLNGITSNLNGHQVPFYNGVGSVQKGRPRKRKSPEPDPCSQGLGMGGNENLDGDPLDRDYQQQPPRQKRMRTSFKHHQLRTMKSYFSLNHNPDAKDLKQLAQKTGLTKRVLQVWFQNARAKYRRNLLRQEQQRDPNSQSNGVMSPDCKSQDSLQELTELTNAHSPGGLSDISSTPSLSDLGHSMDSEEHQNDTGGSLTDLFSSSINNLN
ncbi:LIM/homeobox protein Lhx9-like [Tubulanus polymorphus]|uniref:LIM/homeobox protein Lhx9-like n=1 Tax=Tubulanus polymorphus TaxID=672921 RepID=UPI003DA274DF